MLTNEPYCKVLPRSQHEMFRLFNEKKSETGLDFIHFGSWKMNVT